ncbi:MAG: alpha/beta fold hydrolase [Actinomycetota bacterium]|nr:alpha/beta fold hydrolase [Actinomycetota bacterium]
MTPLQTFESQGFTFDVDDLGGSGEAVILLHGYPQSKRSWSAIAPRLADAGYRVLAPDQRGYSAGARPAGRRNYAFGHLLGDVLALADAAGADRFHLVGHDWGGAVAWGMAARYPDRVLTLASLSMPHPRAYRRALLTSDQALRAWYLLLYQLPVLPEAMVTQPSLAPVFRGALVASGLSEARADEYLRFMQGGAIRPAVDWYRALLFIPPQTFKPVEVPTLYIYGAQDRWLGRRAAELTARYVRGPYRYEVLPEEGHWLPEEASQPVTRLVLDHLSR